MKKATLSILVFGALVPLLQGQQLPNAGFEVWTNPAKPDAWYTFTSDGFVNLAGRDASDKTEGNASARIQTGSIAGQTTHEVLSLGTAVYAFGAGYTYRPVHFPYRPDTLMFAYKYLSPGTDTATAYIRLSKGKTILAETEIPLMKSSQWAFPSVLLTALYRGTEQPDSLLIQFKSSKVRRSFFGVEGSTLNVDAVHLGYTGNPASAPALEERVKASVMPNPFGNELTFSLGANASATVTVFNALGQDVLQTSFSNSVTLSTAHLLPGIYFYTLKGNNGSLNTGKIIRQ
jgi:hypothetical protein